MTRDKSPLLFLLLTAFSILTILVAKQIMRPMDLAVTTALQHFASKGLDYGMYLFTLFGSIEFSCFALLVISWYLYRKYDWPGVFLYLFFFMALCGVEYVWKYVVTYTGPGPEFHRNPFQWGLGIATPYSFPSGHMFRGTFLLGIWYERLSKRSGVQGGSILFQKIAIFILASGLGISRIYLGVHWLSDVLGGFLLALIGLLFVSQSPHRELRPA